MSLFEPYRRCSAKQVNLVRMSLGSTFVLSRCGAKPFCKEGAKSMPLTLWVLSKTQYPAWVKKTNHHRERQPGQYPKVFVRIAFIFCNSIAGPRILNLDTAMCFCELVKEQPY